MYDNSPYNSGKIDLRKYLAEGKLNEKKTKIIIVILLVVFLSMLIASIFMGDN